MTINHELVEACKLGETDLVKELLDRGADIHCEQESPLRWASCSGHTETVGLLIKRGADLTAVTHGALYSAHMMGRTRTVKLLLRHYKVQDLTPIVTWSEFPEKEIKAELKKRHAKEVRGLRKNGPELEP